MSEEITPQSDPAATPAPKKKGVKKHRGFLESLPIEVRQEMEERMTSENPTAACEHMKTKYGTQFPVILEIPRSSFHKYFKRHHIKLDVELAHELKSIAPKIGR